MTSFGNPLPRIAPISPFKPWDVRTDAQRLQDAQDQLMQSGAYQDPHGTMLDYTREGWTLGEEAFLTVDRDEWDAFIEAAGDECRDGPDAAFVLTCAAYDELARRDAAKLAEAA